MLCYGVTVSIRRMIGPLQILIGTIYCVTAALIRKLLNSAGNRFHELDHIVGNSNAARGICDDSFTCPNRSSFYKTRIDDFCDDTDVRSNSLIKTDLEPLVW